MYFNTHVKTHISFILTVPSRPVTHVVWITHPSPYALALAGAAELTPWRLFYSCLCLLFDFNLDSTQRCINIKSVD